MFRKLFDKPCYDIFTIKLESAMARRLKFIWHQTLEESRPSDPYPMVSPNYSLTYYYSLRPELDAPQAAQPIKQNICKNPLPRPFLLPVGPKFEIRDGAGHAPELGSRPRRPAAAAPLAEEAVPSRSGGEAELPRRPWKSICPHVWFW
jgi:hypothetical protein